MVINFIFYLCILFLILRIKDDLLNLLKFSFHYVFRYDGVHEEGIYLVDLPIIRFEDLQDRRNGSVEEMCFICSAYYDEDDVVCQLGRCGHVFHSHCVGMLLHRQQTNCPFCRSPLFSGLPVLPRNKFLNQALFRLPCASLVDSSS